MRFLTADVLLAAIRASYGPAIVLRDAGSFASAMVRGHNAFLYQGADAYTVAATLAMGVIKNHPFVDENKRAGCLAALVFLRVNGHGARLPDVSAAVDLIVGMAAGKHSVSDAAARFSEWCPTG